MRLFRVIHTLYEYAESCQVVVRVSPFYVGKPSSVRIMTSVALIRAITSLPASRPSSSALSRVMRLTRWSSPTVQPHLGRRLPFDHLGDPTREPIARAYLHLVSPFPHPLWPSTLWRPLDHSLTSAALRVR